MYDLTIAVSEADAAMLPPNVAVVPNGVDTDRFRPSPPADRPRVVFTGALHTFPNKDGICWFCARIWPDVLRRVEGATLEIVGSRPPPEVRALEAIEGVSIHADVPDVLPYIKRARLAVVPLRVGTGSRIKALEAMSTARPVVGTSIGLGGLNVRHGCEALIADAPVRFADAVVSCLSDTELCGGLGLHGRALVEKQYTWRRIGAGYATLLNERSALRLEVLGAARHAPVACIAKWHAHRQ
jgi:glycosyltransferase involved in cell wall biosynthesis